KTALVRDVLSRRRYLYYSAQETEPEQMETKSDGKNWIVVIDDLHSVALRAYQERYAVVIQKLLERPDVELVLVSRAPIPGWLLPIHIEYGLIEIAEKDFYFSRKEQDTYLEQHGVWLTPDEAQRVWELAHGHPASLRLLALEKGNVNLAMKNMWIWLENHVYDQWETELQEFLMETSIVENYTKELAAMITGRDNVEELISSAEELGNFMTRTGQDGVWEYRWAMRQSMRGRLLKKYSKEQVRWLHSHAGLYYEMHGMFPEAFRMYEVYHEAESISRVLTANARRNPASGQYFELRRYYLALPEETVKQTPALMAYMSMLQSILMDADESERWYAELKAYAESHSGSERREAKRRLISLDIGLPHRGSANLISIFQCTGSLLAGQKSVLPELSVTTNLPSLMNGGKDFCDWSKRDHELAASIGKAVELVLGKYGKGLVSLALAESGLEKGADSYEIMRLAEKGRMCAESGGRVELCFVAAAMLAWLALLNGNAEYAEEIILAFRNRAEKEAPQMLPNINAMLCRIALYQRRPAEVMKWLEEAPEEMKEFCTLERFRYLTKVRAYLQAGKDTAACSLLQQLLYYAEKMKRTYIGMEASLLLAITLRRMGRQEWRETLQKCVTQAESYHFVRLFSREGAAVLELLEAEEITWTDEEMKKQTLEECRRMSKFYPGYLTPGSDGKVMLSENALKILRLQAEGLSIKEIAHKLGIRPDTVKYHSRETYRKLGVTSRTAAVNEARRRKII
ncbi:MAG: LuxR C-terminal-related transcriptional regulator, partial [Eubacteriales bacterium]|nr:LuxR C-terminal-related transcriptional regulator [Eubacteriales bacterium]